MTENNDKNDKVTTTRRVSIPALQQRMNAAKQQEAVNNVATLPNRIGLLLDCSGSMASSEELSDGTLKPRIEVLKDAVTGFVNACNPVDTAVSLRTFPGPFMAPLSNNQSLLIVSVAGLSPSGGTPLGSCMEETVMNDSITRAVIVSDGEATDNPRPMDAASKFCEAGIVIDCVHISKSTSGEKLLRSIAELTGGIYIRFEDVSSFAKNFKYLSPALRGYLASGEVKL